MNRGRAQHPASSGSEENNSWKITSPRLSLGRERGLSWRKMSISRSIFSVYLMRLLFWVVEEKQLDLFTWFSHPWIATWRLMMARPRPSPLCRHAPHDARILPRISYATSGYFLHFISQIRHICKFSIASLLVWSHPLGAWHTDAASVFVVCPVCSDVSPRPSCVAWHVSGAKMPPRSEISHESNQGLLRRDAGNQMHRKLLRTFHSVFAVIPIQCQIWNKKDGAFTNNNGKIAFSASWWDADKSSFRCKRD